MTILVTGASGFIAKSIIQNLADLGTKIVGISRSQIQHQDSNIDAFHSIDISDRSSVVHFANNTPPCESIIHAAADIDMDDFSQGLILSNCLGVQNIAWLAKHWRVNHFVFLSSIPIVGIPPLASITEEHPPRPLTTYHSSKLFGENIVSLLSPGIHAKSLRLSAPVGRGMPANRLLSTIIKRALADEPIELSGKGSRIQNYVDVRDVAHAVSLSLQSQCSGIFNIAGKYSFSNLDLARRCIERCGSRSDIRFTGQVDPQESYDWNISIAKAKEQLGYTPEYSIDDTIDDLIAASRGL